MSPGLFFTQGSSVMCRSIVETEFGNIHQLLSENAELRLRVTYLKQNRRFPIF